MSQVMRVEVEVELDADKLVGQLSSAESQQLLGTLCQHMSDDDILETVEESSIVAYLEANGYTVKEEE
jgi:hypothetical protein